MKKIFYSVLSALLLISCTTSDEPEVKTISEVQHNLHTGKLRTIEEVLDIAANASNMIAPTGNENGLSRGVGRVIDCQTPIYKIGSKESRSCGEDTLIYVVNYTDNNGFALVSAPRNAPELLAVTEKGHYNPSEPVELEGFYLWMDETIEMLETITADYENTNISATQKIVRDTIWYREVAPRVRVAWGQGKDKIISDACEGLECPNGIAGCANTAMAMVMSYVERPSYIQLSYLPEKPIINLNWKELKKYLSYDDTELRVFPQSDYPIRSYLSCLLRELGFEANSTYNTNSTGTSPTVTAALLRQYSVASPSDWVSGGGVASYEVLFNNTGCILLARGNSTQGGHQWVCDGLQNYKIQEKHYESTDGGITWDLSETTSTQEYYYVHYNWGWHGRCNGHYYHTDTWARSNGQGQINFNSNRQIIPILL